MDNNWTTYVKSLVNDIKLNGVEQYVDFTEDDFLEDFDNFKADKMDLNEVFVNQMKHRAGLIK